MNALVTRPGGRITARPVEDESSDAEAAAAAQIDICICTFERPEVVDTLAALSRQTNIAPRHFRVVIADNSRRGTARECVEMAADRFGLDLTFVHAPAANISIARNACLDVARGEWIAFLDDDERPVGNWLAQLLGEARRGDWSAVLGPVFAVYPASAPQWLSRGDFHSTQPVWRNGEIRTGFSGNVLFRRSLAVRAGLRFRIDLGKTGGEDEDFFDCFRDAGGTIGFAPRAICYENVTAARANLKWLLRRNFRAGQSHGARLARQAARPKQISLALAKALYCGARAGLALHDSVPRNRALVRAALHSGAFARLCGLSEIRTY
ncbi:MAG TPA: glycosyltransferase family 2 protein [Rhizomicrobium sp.]|jgi:succinoglycan biosynthesis protein ExoM